MYCSYHTSSVASARCSHCARPLCRACDHRIKGYPYCQDCIVAGIQGLSRDRYARRPVGKARLAALFALFPGMGAVFNRQNIKGVVHFVAIVGLFQLTNLRVAAGFFALGGFAFYLYSIVDAYRTGMAIASGESAAAEEDRFIRALFKRAPLIGIVLIAAGGLLVVQIARPLAFLTMARLLPVALILLGGYLLTRYFKREREVDFSERTPPYSLIPGRFDERASREAGGSARPAGRR